MKKLLNISEAFLYFYPVKEQLNDVEYQSL